MSVWDGNLAKTKEFVTKKGDGMASPVTFTGEQSAFSKNWLDAAGAKAIPHAFVVRNGVLLGATEVLRLTDNLIESLPSGDAGAQKTSDRMSTAQNNQAKTVKEGRMPDSTERSKWVREAVKQIAEEKK